MNFSPSNIIALCVLTLCFFAGGALQFVGFLSLTQSNYVALLLIAAYLVLKPIRIRLDRSEIVLIVLTIYLISGIFLNGSRPENVAVYIYYVFCPFLAVRFAKQALASNASISRVFFPTLFTFLLVQLLVTIFQSSFAEELSNASAVSVIPIDIVSGTFYLASDGSLSAFCILACISTLWTDLSTTKKIIIFSLALSVIGIANSKAFQTLAPILAAWALIEAKLLRGRNSLFKGFILVLGATLIAAVSYGAVFNKLGEFGAYLYDIYDFRYGDNRAQRLAPLGEIFYSPISWAGKGALTYYNPITKEWLYNAGFSLIYMFYFDYGTIGLFLVLTYFLTLTLECAGLSLRSMTLFFVFFVFCAFSPAITDLAFIIAYTFTCTLVKRGRLSIDSVRSPKSLYPTQVSTLPPAAK